MADIRPKAYSAGQLRTTGLLDNQRVKPDVRVTACRLLAFTRRSPAIYRLMER
jgi:hypothetical protein